MSQILPNVIAFLPYAYAYCSHSLFRKGTYGRTFVWTLSGTWCIRMVIRDVDELKSWDSV